MCRMLTHIRGHILQKEAVRLGHRIQGLIQQSARVPKYCVQGFCEIIKITVCGDKRDTILVVIRVSFNIQA